MKCLSTIVLSLCAFIVFGQRIIEKEVGDFHTIKVFDLIEVNLIQANENKILIKGQNTEDIVFANRDGVLKLRMKLDKKFTGENTVIEVFYQDIELVDANEGAVITLNEMITQNNITLKSQEGAKIIAGLKVEYLEIRAVTGGIVAASGTANLQNVVINTGGIYEARNLKTEKTDIKISAGGEAEIHAREKVEIDIKAGGDIIVFGNPNQVYKKTFVGGRIQMVD